ncbi:hypothetical protein EYF80_037328 [Liparis tanakae]|uniref:Uncharacterized protein n=1 Tax=Liparis tanakae TaxID=230148 RepID=A0A4Z2GGB9_9TELE|nr:hypothetical protein EYF80_037328 [Liparis tanakae]
MWKQADDIIGQHGYARVISRLFSWSKISDEGSRAFGKSAAMWPCAVRRSTSEGLAAETPLHTSV